MRTKRFASPPLTVKSLRAATETFLAPDGTELRAQVAGPLEAPPLVLVHGFSMSSDAFFHQLEGPLATQFRVIAPDLRGHGGAATGPDLEALGRSQTWAGDLGAAIGTFATRPPILGGWSFGGRVLCTYLAAGGTAAGAIFISAVADDVLPDGSPPHGPGAAALGQMMSDDRRVADHATTVFVDGMSPVPLAAADRERLLKAALAVPPSVRRAMRTLRSQNSALLASLPFPVLALHGTSDQVIRPASAAAIADAAPDGHLSLMDGVGHAPFLEDPSGFDARVTQFARDALRH